jgi:molecular chaperone GrpE
MTEEENKGLAEESAETPETPVPEAAEEEQPPKQEEAKDAEKKEDEKPEKEDSAEALKKVIADQEIQIAKLKNAYAMAYADTENTRKRLTREYENNMKYHIQSFAQDILPVLDNCERALAIEPKDDGDLAYRKGFEMVLKQLTASLKKEGVEEIEAKDQEYDPNWMQAMMMEHVDGVKPGIVTEVLQKGYRIKDRLLRAAMVKVSE